MENPEIPYQHASKTATIRATVTTAGVRCTNPMERNGKNHTAVPTKKQTKKSSAAGKCSSCAARTPPAPPPAAPQSSPSARIARCLPARSQPARSTHAVSTTPPATPPLRKLCTPPAAQPETTPTAGCDPALPAAEPSFTAPPPARTSPGKPAPLRVPAQAPPRRWPKEKMPPLCPQSRSVREISFVTVVTPAVSSNDPRPQPPAKEWVPPVPRIWGPGKAPTRASTPRHPTKSPASGIYRLFL